MSYDVKCHELAQAFLSDESMTDDVRSKATHDLAQQIQDLIEGFIEFDLVEFREGRA